MALQPHIYPPTVLISNAHRHNVTNDKYLSTYIDFVAEVHGKYPHAQIILIALWNGFDQVGNTYQQGGAFVDEIQQVYAHYKHTGYVHYFNTTGILQHNDIVSMAIKKSGFGEITDVEVIGTAVSSY